MLDSIHDDLKAVKELVYDKCGFGLTNLQLNIESKEYGASSFLVLNKAVYFCYIITCFMISSIHNLTSLRNLIFCKLQKFSQTDYR